MNKEMKELKNKTWLIASLIFLGVLVLIIFAATAYLKDTAWLFLGFAGTALSLVLSVIAIVITLVDVAGQKQQVADISESAKKLRTILEQQKQENKDLKDELINHLNKESIGDLSEIQESLSDISNKIQEDDDELALYKISTFSTGLQDKINKFKRFEEDKTNDPFKGLGGVKMEVKEYRVRKNITEKELLRFKNNESNREFNITSLWIEEQKDKEYDILNIKLMADDLRKNDLVVLVMAEFGVNS